MITPMILGLTAVTALLARARASRSAISHDGVTPISYGPKSSSSLPFVKTNTNPPPYTYPTPSNQLPYDSTPPSPSDIIDPWADGSSAPGGDPAVWQPGTEPATHDAAIIDAAKKEAAATAASNNAAVKQQAAQQAAKVADTDQQKTAANAAALKAATEKLAADKAAALANNAKNTAVAKKIAAPAPKPKPAAKPTASVIKTATKAAPAPAPKPVVTTTTTSTIPAGTNLVLAKQLAPSIETDIVKNKFNYSRPNLTKFQVAAGLAGDGIYGGYTAGALTFFLGHTAPKPLFAPTTIKPYVPPGEDSAHGSASTNTSKPVATTTTAVKPLEVVNATGYNETLAKKLAPQVESNIVAKKSNYDHTLLKNFQTAAGITADGIYGGGTAGALRYYLGHAPPKPLFKPTIEQPYKKPGSSSTPVTNTSTTTTTTAKPTALAPAEAAKQLRDYLLATGDFGDKAHPSSKVKELQGPLGTTADGIVGPNTRTAASKYGITLPLKGAVATAPSQEDLMKQPPSTLLALRSVEAPTSSAVAGAASQDLVPSMTPTQASALLAKIQAWGQSSISITQQVLLYNQLLQLAKDKNKSMTLPLTWTQVSAVLDHPAAACAMLTSTLGQGTVNSLFALEPTLKSRWLLYCSSQVTMPAGFPAAIWAQADDAQKRQIIMNWMPGVQVVQPAKSAAKTTTSTPAANTTPVVVKPAGTAPAGYNPAEAKRLAPLVVKEVAARSYDYNKGVVKNFQTAAGVPADGILGGGTANALKYFGAKNAKNLFKPAMSDPAAAYHPPV